MTKNEVRKQAAETRIEARYSGKKRCWHFRGSRKWLSVPVQRITSAKELTLILEGAK